jgi:exosortase A
MMEESLVTQTNDKIPAPERDEVSAARRRAWRSLALLTVGLVAAVFILFWQTSWSVISIWIRSETFTHGFLILPISAWLVWQKRDEVLPLTPAPNWWGIPLLLVIGLGWFVAHSAGVLVVEQLAMVAMVPAAVWSLLGWQVAWRLVFPLLFLFFAVPMGEELVPPLMDFTANFTVAALQLTGIPVYHEGTYFEIPSGRWTVVEACSGIRYLIASVTLGCLYAYLTFRRPYRRLLFVALSAVVPIFANGIRAYGIVMIAHLSNMRLAVGIDHIIYGWLFFGLVMLILFWIGSFWREDGVSQGSSGSGGMALPAAPIRPRPVFAAAGAAFLAVALWPALGMLHGQEAVLAAGTLKAPAPQGGWQLSAEPFTAWRPHYVNADAVADQTYRLDGQEVNLYLAYYVRQRQGAELINSQNVLITQKQREWRQTADTPHRVDLDGKTLEVRLAKLHTDREHLMVWYWYWVDGRTTTNHYLAKLWDAKIKLLGGRGDAAAIIVTAPYTDQGADAEAALRAFMIAMRPAIEASLERMGRE